MAPQRRLQSLASQSQHADRPFDAARKLREVLGVAPVQLVTMAELAEARRFPSGEAARKFVHRHCPELLRRRGRIVLVDLAAFDRACARDARQSA